MAAGWVRCGCPGLAGHPFSQGTPSAQTIGSTSGLPAGRPPVTETTQTQATLLPSFRLSSTNQTQVDRERERLRMEFYATYDVMTGVRIAATLGGFFGLMVFLVIYKSRTRSTAKALKVGRPIRVGLADTKQGDVLTPMFNPPWMPFSTLFYLPFDLLLHSLIH